MGRDATPTSQPGGAAPTGSTGRPRSASPGGGHAGTKSCRSSAADPGRRPDRTTPRPAGQASVFASIAAGDGWQGLRFLTVALIAYGANLALLAGLIAFGVDKVLAQAIAVVLVTPLNFVGNKLWSFRAGA